MSRRGSSINTRQLTAELKTFDSRMNKAITAAFEYQAPKSTARMKSSARWTDRTGNARSGLFARTKHEGDRHQMTVSHGVAYGIYLENRFSGRYAVVRPEILLAAHDIQRLMGKLFDTLPRR